MEMNMEQAITKREELLAEARKINQAIKILSSESIPGCTGTKMAIGQYRKRLEEINNEIIELAEACKPKAIKIGSIAAGTTLDSKQFRTVIERLIEIYNSAPEDQTFEFV